MAVVLRAKLQHNALMERQDSKRENHTEFQHSTHLHHLDKTLDSSSLFLVTAPPNETYLKKKSMAIDFLSATAAMQGLSSAVVMLVVS